MSETKSNKAQEKHGETTRKKVVKKTQAKSKATAKKSTTKKATKKTTTQKPVNKQKVNDDSGVQSNVENKNLESHEMAKSAATSSDKKTSTPSSTSVDNPVQSSPTTQTSKSSSGLLWVVAGLALIGTGYNLYTNFIDNDNNQLSSAVDEKILAMDESMKQQMNQIDQANAETLAQLELAKKTVEGTLSVQQQSLETLETRIQSQNASSDNRLDNLSSIVTELQGDAGNVTQKISLVEVEQLLSLANLRLSLGGEIPLAISALTSAYQIVENMPGIQFVSVKKTLASEIESLHAIPEIDYSQTVSRIYRLSDAVDDLPLQGDELLEQSTQTQNLDSESEVAEDEPWWQSSVTGLVSEISEMIEVKDDSSGVKPIVDSDLRSIIVSRTKLLLESAALAFLRKDNALYAHQLDLVKNSMGGQFDLSMPEGLEWSNELDILMQLNPDPPLPDISKSLAALRELPGTGG